MATKLPSGNYRTLVQIGDRKDRKYKSFTAKTAREADMKAEMWKLTSHVSAGSLQSCAKRFIADTRASFSPNTYRSYCGIYKILCEDLPDLMQKDMSEIRKEDLLSVTRLNKKPKTIKNYLGFISAVYSYKEMQIPKIKTPECPRIALNIPDEKTIKAITKASQRTNLEVPIALAIRGMRAGEICAVTSADLDGNVLHISHSMAYTGRGYVRKSPKTKASDRKILVPDHIAKKIKEDGRATELTNGALNAAFRRFLEKNNFEHFRFHDLRHAFVSIAHANGIPDSYIMSMGGWSTPYTMQNVYRHSLDSSLEKYSKKMDQILK